MKYKLINSVSKIETTCDKVTMDGFDYYVSDERAVANDFALYGGCITKKIVDTEWTTDDKKVIATNNPNIDIPKVLDEVERLAEKCTEETQSSRMKRVWKAGYNKSQETHPFSEEDIIAFGKWIALNCYRFTPNYKGEDKTTWWDAGDLNNPKKETPISTKELLEIWKEQRTKTIYFS